MEFSLSIKDEHPLSATKVEVKISLQGMQVVQSSSEEEGVGQQETAM